MAAASRSRLTMSAPQLERARRYAREWAKNKRQGNPALRQRQSDAARAWQKANPIRNARNEYRKRAMSKGFTYDLTAERFDTLVMTECFYCGGLPDPINGIDRIDCASGYVEGNVVSACRTCNLAKGSLTIHQFQDWILRLVKRLPFIDNAPRQEE